MTPVLRTPLGIVAGLALTFALVVAVEMFSAVVHPFPPGFDGNIPLHVQRYPHWVLAAVVPMWGGTAFAGAWVAARVGTRLAGMLVAALIGGALLFNLSLLPYTPWFKVVMPVAVAFACWLALRPRATRGSLRA